LMARRLQTQVHKQGFANSARHARQLVVHGHIAIAGRRVTVPSYILPTSEQELVGYYDGSPLRQVGDSEKQASSGA
jgi:small subunit ribosomal protein S4